MKLNYDCLRDTLKALETHMVLQNGKPVKVGYDKIMEYLELSEYSDDEVIYAISQMSYLGYLETLIELERKDIICTVYDILPPGHELLKDISSDTIWNDVKKHIKVLGDVSLPLIKEIAGKLILKQLGY